MSSSVNGQNESITHICLFFKGKIKDMFPPGSINCTTTLALVNAIHFKGQWATKFKEKNTRKMPFRLNKVQLNKDCWEQGKTGKVLVDCALLSAGQVSAQLRCGAKFVQAKSLYPVKWENSILFPSASVTEVM